MIDPRNPNHQPAPTWKRWLFTPVLGWLTFHANRRYRSQSWYAIKDQVLGQYGTVDGCDMQVFQPAECWSCEKGIDCITGYRCQRCDGAGNYTPVRYVRLERRKLGRYVFHSPTASAHPVQLMHMEHNFWERKWQPKSVIEGLIIHKQGKHGKWLGYRTRIVLELLFDFKRFAPILLDRWTFRPRNWFFEQGRLWRFGCHPLQQPRFSPWHRTADRAGLQDDDLPF